MNTESFCYIFFVISDSLLTKSSLVSIHILGCCFNFTTLSIGLEAHGGYSFCGYAAVVLLGQEQKVNIKRLLVCWFIFVFVSLYFNNFKAPYLDSAIIVSLNIKKPVSTYNYT